MNDAQFSPGVKISQKFKKRALIIPPARFGFPNVCYTSGIQMSQHFQGPFGPFVETFFGPSPNFEGSWSKGPPYCDP